MMASVNISGIENASHNNALRKYRREKELSRNLPPRKAKLKKNQSAAANFISSKDNNRDLKPSYTSLENPNDIVKQLPPSPFDILPTISDSEGGQEQEQEQDKSYEDSSSKNEKSAFTLEIGKSKLREEGEEENEEGEEEQPRPREISNKLLGFSAEDSHLTAQEMKEKLYAEDPVRYEKMILEQNSTKLKNNKEKENQRSKSNLVKAYSSQETRLLQIEDRLDNLVDQVNKIGDTLRNEITAFLSDQRKSGDDKEKGTTQ